MGGIGTGERHGRQARAYHARLSKLQHSTQEDLAMKFNTRLRMEALEDRAMLSGTRLPYHENFYTCHARETDNECPETPSAEVASTSSVPTGDNCTPKPYCPTNGQTPSATSENCQPKTTCETKTESTYCVPKTSCQEQPNGTYEPTGNCDTSVPRESCSRPKNCEPTTAPASAKSYGESRWSENCQRPPKNCDSVPAARSSSQQCAPKSSETCVRQTSNCDSGASAKKSWDRCETQEQRKQSSRNERCAESVKTTSSPSNDCAFADQQWLARLLRA
jgi:hypothetical protein